MISRLEDQHTDFDSFARRRARQAVRVIERGMRGEASTTVVLRVVAQQNRFVAFHPAENSTSDVRIAEIPTKRKKLLTLLIASMS